MPKVLLTNGFLRKTLAAARDLGRQGVDVTISDAHRPIPSAWSKYCQASRVYPNPLTHLEAFQTWLLAELEQHPYDMFLPMDDDTMDVAVHMQSQLSKRTRVLLPPTAAYQSLRDKYKATRAAHVFGFQVPNTFLPESEADLDGYAARLTWPVVVKPRQASGSRGLRVVRSKPELLAEYASVSGKHKQPMLQSYIPPGPRTDICLLLDSEQNLLADFSQRELRHFPMPYGPSTMQESVLEPELVQQCYEFAKQLGWTGLLEFEFMQDAESGAMYFLEVNTRPWNSLHLAIQAGVPFPWLIFDYLVNNKTVPPTPYQVGLRCRNVLPTDTLHFLTNPNRWQMNPPFFASPRKGAVDDILSWSDPLPTLGFTFALAALAFRKGALKEAFKR